MKSLRFLSVRFSLRAVVIVAMVCAFSASAHATIQYDVSLAHPEQHLFQVSIRVPNVSRELTVQIPAWNALYQIRDFSAHVEQVTASAGGIDAPIEKIDKQTWRITATGNVMIRYGTYWDEAGPFATQLNLDHAFINPAMILMYVPDRRAENVSLTLSAIPADWQIAGALVPNASGIAASVRDVLLEATDYDALADAPIEAGKFSSFQVSGTNPQIWVVIHGDGWDKREVGDELRRICGYEIKMMGGAPFARYTFIVHVGKGAAGAGGGMEHSNSTAISVRAAGFFPNVAAHEFFHLWNVKRIRPASLEPVDYTKEQYTRALWFAEGVTSTYGSYALTRSGLWSKDQFYEDLSDQISELESRPADAWQSAEESSLDAWLEKYPLYNRPQDSVSYYTKGQVLGVLLDILIRDRTNNEHSLDDVMRAMNVEFAQQHKPYRDSLDVRLTAEKVAGGSFEEFFKKYVANAEPLPYEQTLALAGLDLHTTQRKRAALGFFLERDASGALTVRSVDPGSPAAEAGVRIGDSIVSWNGSDPPRNPERWASSQKPGSALRLKVRREEKEVEINTQLAEMTETFLAVTEAAQASEKQRRIREGILRGVTQPVTASLR